MQSENCNFTVYKPVEVLCCLKLELNQYDMSSVLGSSDALVWLQPFHFYNTEIRVFMI